MKAKLIRSSESLSLCCIETALKSRVKILSISESEIKFISNNRSVFLGFMFTMIGKSSITKYNQQYIYDARMGKQIGFYAFFYFLCGFVITQDPRLLVILITILTALIVTGVTYFYWRMLQKNFFYGIKVCDNHLNTFTST